MILNHLYQNPEFALRTHLSGSSYKLEIHLEKQYCKEQCKGSFKNYVSRIFWIFWTCVCVSRGYSMFIFKSLALRVFECAQRSIQNLKVWPLSQILATSQGTEVFSL